MRFEPAHQPGLDDVQQLQGCSRLPLKLQRPLDGPVGTVGQIGGDQDMLGIASAHRAYDVHSSILISLN
ncbi:MAG: hypothetical protein WAN86_08240, partial [Hyphomicrobiaceae bacterium]